MKRYLNLIIVVLAATALFCSCKKSSGTDPDTTAAFMKFSANGASVKYSNCKYTVSTPNGIPQIAIIANNITPNGIGDDYLQVIILHDPAKLKAGQTYQAGGVSLGVDDSYLDYGLSITHDHEFDSAVNNPQGSVTITAATATTISGTFSGKLYPSGDIDGILSGYTITNGSFNAKKFQ